MRVNVNGKACSLPDVVSNADVLAAVEAPPSYRVLVNAPGQPERELVSTERLHVAPGTQFFVIPPVVNRLGK